MAELKITALKIEDVATVLQKSGSILATEELIQSDIDAGAPIQNEDGTINLIKYTAWLFQNHK